MDIQEKKEIHAQVKRDVLAEIQLEGRYFGKGAFSSFGTYLGAAFGFVLGLAWNNAIQTWINYYFPDGSNSIAIHFYYAIGLTIVVAAVSYVVHRIVHNDNTTAH